MTSVLRIYEPGECDEHGVPLDWPECRACDGTGHREALFPKQPCPDCDGHGSLRAAALYTVNVQVDNRHERDVRCNACGHPMSEGTWEGPDERFTKGHPRGDGALFIRERDEAHALAIALRDLRAGRTPFGFEGGGEPRSAPRFYSACDEGCRHDGVGVRWRSGDGPWQDGRGLPDGTAVTWDVMEASWRPVDVRTLSWPHDLRPGRLAVLCLRCWAEGSR